MTRIKDEFYHRSLITISLLGLAVLLLFSNSSFSAINKPTTPPKWIGIGEDRGSINLKWFRVEGAVTYVVQRREGEKGEFLKVGQVSNPTFDDLNVQAGKFYFYRIIPVGRDGSEGPVSEARYYQVEKPESQLITPPDWNAKMLDHDGIALSWAHPLGKQVLAFNLYRKVQGDSTFSLLTSTLNTNYRDRSVKKGLTYMYVLTALDMKLQESDFSKILTVSFTPEVSAGDKDGRFSSIKTLEEVVQLTEPVAQYDWEDYGFVSPTDIAYRESRDILYVSDTATGYITAISAQGEILNRFGGKGEGPAAFERLLGIAVDQQGDIYAVDAYRGEVAIFNPQGVLNRRIGLLEDIHKYFGSDLFVRYPWFRLGIVDVQPLPDGGLIVVDNPNGWYYVLDAHDRIVKVVGEKGLEPGRMQYPTFIQIDQNANVLVSDTLNSRVQLFDRKGSHLAFVGERGLGIGQFLRPKGIALDDRGNIYVADSQHNVVQVFTRGGEFISLLGNEIGLPLDLGSPNGIVFAEPDLLMICEKLARRIQVRRVLDRFASDIGGEEKEPQKKPSQERIYAPVVRDR